MIKLQEYYPVKENQVLGFDEIHIGKLRVRLPAQFRKDKHNKVEVQCTCICSEKSFFVRVTSLIKKNPTLSCGCLRKRKKMDANYAVGYFDIVDDKMISEADRRRRLFNHNEYIGTVYCLDNYTKPLFCDKKAFNYYQLSSYCGLEMIHIQRSSDKYNVSYNEDTKQFELKTEITDRPEEIAHKETLEQIKHELHWEDRFELSENDIFELWKVWKENMLQKPL